MPVEHSLIAYGGVVLVEDKMTPPRLSPVIQKLVANAARHDSKASYQYDGSLYSCMVEHEILYMVVVNAAAPPGGSPNSTTVMSYTFIADMQNKFKSAMTGNPNSYPTPPDLSPARCQSFAPTMQNLVKTYTDNPNHNNKMVKLKTDIEVVKTQMLENIDAIVKRGGDIERICDKTENLAEDAETFNRRATSLRRKMLMKNIKLAIAIVVALIVLSIIISMFACGVDYSKCSKKKTTTTEVPGEYTWTPLPPGATLTPGVVTPYPVTANPVTSNPATPNPVTPNPATANPATPNPATPNPVTPNPGTPNPATPNPAAR